MKKIFLSLALGSAVISTQAQDRIYWSASCPTFARMAAGAETMAVTSSSVANPSGSTSGWFQGSIDPTTGTLTPGTNYYNSTAIKAEYPMGISPNGYLYSIAGNVTNNNNGVIQLAYKPAAVFTNTAPTLTPSIDLNGTSNPTDDIYPYALGIGASGSGGFIYEDGAGMKYISFTTAANGSVTWGSSVVISLLNSDAPAAWNSYIEIADLDFDAAGNLYILGTRYTASTSEPQPAIYMVPAANVGTGAMTANLQWAIIDSKNLGGLGGNRGLAYSNGTFYLSQSSTTDFTTYTNYITAIQPPATGTSIVLGDNYTSLTGYCEITDLAVIPASVLPADWGSINALVQNGQLKVQWQTLKEASNDHFEVEASADGVTFSSIGKVDSKANNGNSDTALDYSFNIDVNGVVLGFSAVALLLLFVRRRKTFLALATVLSIVMIVQIGCSKTSNDVATTSSTLFVRIAQVDKDGKKTYSKVIQARK